MKCETSEFRLCRYISLGIVQVLNGRNTKLLNMNETELPERATRENALKVIELATHMPEIESPFKRKLYKGKSLMDLLLRYVLSIVILALWYSPSFLGLLGEYGTTPMRELPLHVNLLLGCYTFSGIIIALCLGIWKGGKVTNWVFYGVVKLPKPEYEVFRIFSAVAKHLLEGERRKAVEKLSSLSREVKNYWDVNDGLKRYLRSELLMFRDTISLGRLILYSEKAEIELPYCFLDLGLSLIHQRFSLLYSRIEELRSDTKKFSIGKPARIERFIGFLKMSEYVKNLVLIIIVIISFILWLFYGIKFTFPSG